MAPLRTVDLWLYSVLFFCLSAQLVNGDSNNAAAKAAVTAAPLQKSVRKELKEQPSPEATVAPLPLDKHAAAAVVPDGAQQKVVVISERTLEEIESEKSKNAPAHKLPAEEQHTRKTTAGVVEQVHIEETDYKVKLSHGDPNDLSDSFIKGIYLVMALSSLAVLFIVFKVYRLRLSRAERKYGVQGDRTTQELTPLPVTIEDGNSDDEDQTLFEINRQQMRIL